MEDYELSQTADQIQAAITKAAKLPSISSEDSGKVLIVNSLGTISAQTPSGGSGHLYQHTIRLDKVSYDNETNIKIVFTLFSTSSTAITNWSGLLAALPEFVMASGYINNTTYAMQVTDIMMMYGQMYVAGYRPYTSAASNNIYDNTSINISDSLGQSCDILDIVTEIL